MTRIYSVSLHSAGINLFNLSFRDWIELTTCTIFSSFMRAHAQVMNEYRGGEMSTEVVVHGYLWTEIVDCRSTEVKVFSVLVRGS